MRHANQKLIDLTPTLKALRGLVLARLGDDDEGHGFKITLVGKTFSLLGSFAHEGLGA